MMRPKRSTRMLYIIGPTTIDCYHAAKAFGLEPPYIENFRMIKSAEALRGTTPGTPFIAVHRDTWLATRQGEQLDLALSLMQRQGRLRIANEADLKAHRMYDDAPLRETRV